MTKQKSMLHFLWLLVLLPVVFMFTACGSPFDKEAKCDTSGNYTATDYATYANVLGNQAGGVFYRLTLTETEGNNSDYVNGIVKNNEFALKTVRKNGNTQVTTYYYFTKRTIGEGDAARKVNVLYSWKQESGKEDVKGFVVKENVSADECLEDIAGDYAGPQGMLTAIDVMYDNLGTDLGVSVNGNHFKFGPVTVYGQKMTAYVNFDGNKALQAYKGIREPAEGVVGGAKSTVTIEQISASEDLGFPNFGDYKQLLEV